jgi:nucleoside-diphosphate-sugar epimerase
VSWNGTGVLVTGGASFIGSHLVAALLERGAAVRVVDDLRSGKRENLDGLDVEFLEGDLLDQTMIRRAVDGGDVVFHLAADHGGRGYVDLHQSACASNLALDANLFRSAIDAGVGKVVYASSGCVYPNFRSADPDEVLYLTEAMAGPPFDADNMYGWAKLMGEMTLSHLVNERGLRAVSLRYFTVYGERGKEDHAVMAMIARAFLKQDPFVVWGDGRQIRNWTHVSDIVEGTILAAERIDDGSAINLGTTERTSVLDAVKEVMAYTDHDADIELHPDMPTGPMNRVADNRLANELLDWEPGVTFVDGLHRTIDWYFETKSPVDVATRLETALTER